MMEIAAITPDCDARRSGSHSCGRYPRVARVAMCALLTFPLVACERSSDSEAVASVQSSVVRPIKMGHEQIAGGIFEDYDPVVEFREVGDQRWSTADVETFISSDRKFDAGMYRSDPVRMEVDEPYGVDEFMYFLEGSVILTSADGSEMTIGAGDAVTIPKEWTGVWDTPEGYMKIYVIHYPEPIE